MAKKKGKKKKAEEMPVGKILPEFKEISKAAPEKIGKKGVYAKIKATEKFTGQLETSVRKLQSDTSTQVKENESAVRKIGVGVKEIQKGISEKADVVEEAVKRIHADVSKQVKENESAVRKINVGVKEIQKGISEKADVIEEAVGRIHNDVSKQVKENEAAVKNINAGVREIQAGIKAQARENEACVKDFYYG